MKTWINLTAPFALCAGVAHAQPARAQLLQAVSLCALLFILASAYVAY